MITTKYKLRSRLIENTTTDMIATKTKNIYVLTWLRQRSGYESN